MRRAIWLSVALALVIAYPLLFSTPFQQRLGALVLLYAIAASAWNIVGGYAGQVSVGHVVFFGCGAYAAMGAYAHFGFAQRVGEEAADGALRNSHWQCFSEWLSFSLEEQKADLDLYLSGIDSDKRTILETWTRSKPYRNLIPAKAMEVERRLYNSDLETLLELLTVVHGVSSRDRDA